MSILTYVLNGQSPTFEQNGFEPLANVQRE